MTRRSRSLLRAGGALALTALLVLGLRAGTGAQEAADPPPVPGSAGEGAPENGGPPATGAEAPGARQAEPGTPQLASVTYQREFFDYDGGGRRDPFKPLLDVENAFGGPRFDELFLTGVFRSTEEGGMIVVEDADRKGYFLKPGDVVGKATLIEIGTDAAVFDVRDFGISRRETLKLQRPEEIP